MTNSIKTYKAIKVWVDAETSNNILLLYYDWTFCDLAIVRPSTAAGLIISFMV